MKNGLKYTLIGVSVVAVGLATYFAFKKPKTSKAYSSSLDFPNSTDGAIQVFFNPKEKADELYEAMNSYSITQGATNEQAITDILYNVNQLDFSKIYKAFGLRNYNNFAGRDAPFGKLRNLGQWLRAELESDNKADWDRLKKLYPKQLSNVKI